MVPSVKFRVRHVLVFFELYIVPVCISEPLYMLSLLCLYPATLFCLKLWSVPAFWSKYLFLGADRPSWTTETTMHSHCVPSMDYLEQVEVTPFEQTVFGTFPAEFCCSLSPHNLCPLAGFSVQGKGKPEVWIQSWICLLPWDDLEQVM